MRKKRAHRRQETFNWPRFSRCKILHFSRICQFRCSWKFGTYY